MLLFFWHGILTLGALQMNHCIIGTPGGPSLSRILWLKLLFPPSWHYRDHMDLPLVLFHCTGLGYSASCTLLAWTYAVLAHCIRAYDLRSQQAFVHPVPLHPCIWFNIMSCPSPMYPWNSLPMYMCPPPPMQVDGHVHVRELPLPAHIPLPSPCHAHHLPKFPPPYSPFALVVLSFFCQRFVLPCVFFLSFRPFAFGILLLFKKIWRGMVGWQLAPTTRGLL